MLSPLPQPLDNQGQQRDFAQGHIWAFFTPPISYMDQQKHSVEQMHQRDE
jgi:hypothetical protein